MATHTQRLSDVEWSYDESGPGGADVPVVLLHGFPLDSTMWEAQSQALGDAGHRVIAPDLRGFGRSRSDVPFSIESLADDVHALLGAVGALPCVLAGFSMGGYVAIALARKFPGSLRGLVLIDTKAEADTAEGKAGRQTMIGLVKTGGSAAVAGQMMPKMLARDTPERRPQVAQALSQIMHACPPRTIENALAAMRDRPDRSGELPSIRVPTLVIVGDADAITPPAVAESIAGKIPGAHLVTIRGAGHMSPMEQPEQVNRALLAFIGALA